MRKRIQEKNQVNISQFGRIMDGEGEGFKTSERVFSEIKEMAKQ